MNFLKIILNGLFLSFALCAHAQDPNPDSLLMAKADSMMAAKKAFARAAVMSVHLPDKADTLDTDDPAIKIILYNDYTWRFIKDPAVIMKQDVFSEYWDDRNADPLLRQAVRCSKVPSHGNDERLLRRRTLRHPAEVRGI